MAIGAYCKPVISAYGIRGWGKHHTADGDMAAQYPETPGKYSSCKPMGRAGLTRAAVAEGLEVPAG